MSDKFEDETWYLEGRRAAALGYSLASNPYYDPEDPNYECYQQAEWDRGWEAAKLQEGNTE